MNPVSTGANPNWAYSPSASSVRSNRRRIPIVVLTAHHGGDEVLAEPPSAERRQDDDVGQPGERRPVGHEPAERSGVAVRADHGEAARRGDRPLLQRPGSSLRPVRRRRAATATRRDGRSRRWSVVSRSPGSTLAAWQRCWRWHRVGTASRRTGCGGRHRWRRARTDRRRAGDRRSSARNALTSNGLATACRRANPTRSARSGPGSRLTPSAWAQPMAIVSRLAAPDDDRRRRRAVGHGHRRGDPYVFTGERLAGPDRAQGTDRLAEDRPPRRRRGDWAPDRPRLRRPLAARRRPRPRRRVGPDRAPATAAS